MCLVWSRRVLPHGHTKIPAMKLSTSMKIGRWTWTRWWIFISGGFVGSLLHESWKVHQSTLARDNTPYCLCRKPWNALCVLHPPDLYVLARMHRAGQLQRRSRKEWEGEGQTSAKRTPGCWSEGQTIHLHSSDDTNFLGCIEVFSNYPLNDNRRRGVTITFLHSCHGFTTDLCCPYWRCSAEKSSIFFIYWG